MEMRDCDIDINLAANGIGPIIDANQETGDATRRQGQSTMKISSSRNVIINEVFSLKTNKLPDELFRNLKRDVKRYHSKLANSIYSLKFNILYISITLFYVLHKSYISIASFQTKLGLLMERFQHSIENINTSISYGSLVNFGNNLCSKLSVNVYRKTQTSARSENVRLKFSTRVKNVRFDWIGTSKRRFVIVLLTLLCGSTSEG